MLLDDDSTELSDRAALNYLLGWTEIRHRGNPLIPLEYFSAAAREARGSGDRELAKRASGHLAFGQTWAGRLTEARQSLAITGWPWVSGEAWVPVLAFGVAVVAALLPALHAYRVDVTQLLNSR